MKKILSIILSVAMIFAVSASATAVFAADPGVGSIETTAPTRPIIVTVNGNSSRDVSYDVEVEDPLTLTFTYTGPGKLIGWEFPGMVEGTDYEIVSRDGNKITIEVKAAYDNEVIANAIVEGETTTQAAAQGNESTSPDTGVIAATGLGVAGAGAAILVALKKKNDAE